MLGGFDGVLLGKIEGARVIDLVPFSAASNDDDEERLSRFLTTSSTAEATMAATTTKNKVAMIALT